MTSRTHDKAPDGAFFSIQTLLRNGPASRAAGP